MKKIYTILLSCLFVFAGCINHSEPDSVDTPASGDIPLSVSAVSLSGSIGTKALQTSGNMGVFRIAANGYTALNNAGYTYSSGWIANTPVYLNSNAASVCGYYPFGASGITTSTSPASVTLTSKMYSAAEDLCYSTLVSTPTAASPGVSFSMKHAYAKLTINITRSAIYDRGSCNITNISISGAGFKSTNTLDMTTGAYGSSTAGIVSYNPNLSPISLGGTATSSVLVVPTTLTGNLQFNFTVDGSQKMASLPVATNNLSTLAAGGNYNINISIGDNAQPEVESNCYIVAPGSTIYIPVSRATTGNAANFPSNSSFSTGLLWSDVSATHVTATVAGRYIKVVAGSAAGNSVVYAKNTAGNIVWSWHIWITNYNPSATTYAYMDRNLGASTNGVSSSAYGLYYQWGRKDPFPGGANNAKAMPTTYGSAPATLKYGLIGPTSVAYSIATPNTFYWSPMSPYDWLITQNDVLWNKPGKTIYDPCPDGWRIPLYTEFSVAFQLANVCSGAWSSDGTFIYAGVVGLWWSGDAIGTKVRYFGSNGYLNGENRACGFSVRCIKI